MRKIIWRVSLESSLNFDWSSRSLFFNFFFRRFLYWQNNVELEKFSIKFISILRKDIGFRSFEDPNLKSDIPASRRKKKKKNGLTYFVPLYTTRRNFGKLRTINANFQLGNNRPFSMVFRRKDFSRFSKRKTFDPVQVPSIVEPKLLSRSFTMKLRFNPLQYQLLFSWSGWWRSVRRIGGKFKYSRQIQNPSSLTRVTLEKDRR